MVVKSQQKRTEFVTRDLVVTDPTRTATVGETTDATGTDIGTGTETGGAAANTSTAKTPKNRSEGFPTKTRACKF